jgi:signal transduction histidine kinase
MADEQIRDIGAYRQFERRVYEQQGTGLGLSVAKKLAEVHGGSLSLESELDKRTSVTVILPLAKPVVQQK